MGPRGWVSRLVAVPAVAVLRGQPHPRRIVASPTFGVVE